MEGVPGAYGKPTKWLFYFMKYKIRDCNIYLIRLYNDHESFYKIGVTVHKYCRFRLIQKQSNFNYKVDIIYMVFGIDMSDAYKLEDYLKNYFDNLNYTPKVWFGGYSECFKNINIQEYKSILKNYHNDKTIENFELI